ncbi:Glycosyltransferase involved in cell wall bisynthesis [Roseivivax lentus]|uniref:Glycosyltransferase involved in cell wall bisynthesis n=1 Tax=Roseivivax lentus TaxID=633194 RepID=A0A1N7Q260_9RHOB|nr:glycosyltransferase [Roseivivax lentus]SIT16940.1 Glycosyltransferase involved in cell wall bisynthesis [Roseivivax lentus]
MTNIRPGALDGSKPNANLKALPLVSIGLPVYNGAAYIEQAVASLQAQTYPNIEIVISDNCSTDATPDICKRLSGADPRISYSCTSANIGAAGNFNRVAMVAKGTLFAWANHDDLWDPTYVESAVAALSSNRSAILAYAQSAKIDEYGDTIIELNAGLALDAVEPALRLKRYHDLFVGVDQRKAWGKEAIEGFWIPIYGVIRTDMLRQTSLIGNYIASDTILIEELLMLGAFVEIEKRLFFKRDHRDRSMRDSEEYDARTEWFSGKQAPRLIFPRWRAFWQRVRGAIVLPSGRDRVRCFQEMCGFYVRRRSEGNALVKEIIINFVRLFLGPSRSARLFGNW